MSDSEKPALPDSPDSDPKPHSPHPKRGSDTRPGEGPSHQTRANVGIGEFSYLDPPQAPDEIGQLGPYRVLRVLGQGGMGVVFEAEDPLLGRRVAIKVPLGAMSDEGYRLRFQREARLAATLPHDHIAAIYQAGQHNGVPFLAMELLRGESLEERLARDKSLPVAEAVRIAREVAVGLQAAHSRDLVHRDIKPANIWLEHAEGHGAPRVKILDFGVAREFQPRQGITLEGQIIGSVGYMAPEQIVYGRLDGRTDLFALGCVLYQMLHGGLPFAGTNTIATLRAVLHSEPEQMPPTAPSLPAGLTALLGELLQKDPDHRPASAEVVAERLVQVERELNRPRTAVGATRTRLLALVGERPSAWGIFFGAAAIVLAGLVGVLALARKITEPAKTTGTAGQPAVVAPVPAGEPIKVGILHSMSGPLASTEMAVAEATLLAIDEINQKGGLLGRKIEALLEDGRSTEEGFAAAAEKLLGEDRAVTLFGCWTASTRRRVETVCARHDSLLLYPINSDGLEQSSYVFYLGGAPNQQVVPAAGWAVGLLGKHRFFQVGSDYVYSHVCNEILRGRLKELRAECVGEEYVPLHGVRPRRFAEIVEQIKKSGADAILNSIDGNQANIAFFHALAEAGLQAKEVPCISFCFFEGGLRELPEREAADHYSVASYFQSLSNPVNRDFIKRLKARYPTRPANDPMATAFSGVHLWAQAVAEAGSTNADTIRRALRRQEFDGPEGMIRIDPTTQYAVRATMVGQAAGNREFEVVFVSPKPVVPEPFPGPRTRAQWEQFLQGLYKQWGDRWEGPGQ
jgi:urea transport system substrate-binding protein